MRKLLLACLLALACPGLACADNDKIDPATYVCAELVSEPGIMKGEPPLFQALQIDGYVAAELKMDVASPDTVQVMMQQTFMWCQKPPDVPVINPWREARKTGPVPEGHWNAHTSTCRDYALNPDDASGFIIWLDGYNRKFRNTAKSVLNSDADLQEFIDACTISPSRTMLDVLNEHAK